MGNGKKNKHGGGPKQKGRLQTGASPPQTPSCPQLTPRLAALAGSLSATAARQRALIAQQSAEDRVKSSALNAATGGGKKRRKQVEREKQRAAGIKRAEDDEDLEEEETGDVEMAPVVEGGEKKRERKRGTIPYKVGEKVLLVGEGELSSYFACWCFLWAESDRRGARES